MNLEKPKCRMERICAAYAYHYLNAELSGFRLIQAQRYAKTLSLGQYGMTRGVDRILSILKEEK